MIKKINYAYIISLPLLVNFIFNFIVDGGINKLGNVNYFNLISTFIFFSFLLTAGNIIKKTLNLSSHSISIVLYLLSFFIFEYIFSFFNQGYNFHQVVIYVNIFWLIFILLKNRKINDLFYPVFVYSFLNIFNNFYFDKFILNKNIVGDVEAIFYPHSKNIFENSFYFSVANPFMSGYPQFSSYLQSLLLKLSFNQIENFEYFSQTSNILYFLSILFFYELKISNKNKVILCSIFTILVLNSVWLGFLFIDSLMSEGIVSYTFAVIIYNLFRGRSKTSATNYLNFFLLGCLIFSKQFISTIVLLLILFFLITSTYRKYAIVSLAPFLIKEISYFIQFKNIEKDHHLRQIDLNDAILDILLFRDLAFSNIIKIINNLFLDKPISYIFLVLGIYIIWNIYQKNIIEVEKLVYVFIIFINFVFIFLLYISAWKNMELESPIRYMLNLLHMKLAFLFVLIEESNEPN